jgi:hypothetical protein
MEEYILLSLSLSLSLTHTHTHDRFPGLVPFTSSHTQHHGSNSNARARPRRERGAIPGERQRQVLLRVLHRYSQRCAGVLWLMATLACTSAAPRCRPSRVPGGAGAEGHRVRAASCQVHLCQGTPPGSETHHSRPALIHHKHTHTHTHTSTHKHTHTHTHTHTGDGHEVGALLSRAALIRGQTRVCGESSQFKAHWLSDSHAGPLWNARRRRSKLALRRKGGVY